MSQHRRSAEYFGIINRSDFEEILIEARKGKGSGNENGYIREPQNAIRDSALLAFEYITGKRISELVGRDYFDDVYLGLTMDRIRLTTIGETQVLQFKVRIKQQYNKILPALWCIPSQRRISQTTKRNLEMEEHKLRRSF